MNEWEKKYEYKYEYKYKYKLGDKWNWTHNFMVTT